MTNPSIRNNKEIAILMATYNAEKYLHEQIDSILAQTSKDWHLFIHDDGSKDNTIAIIKEYAENHPQEVSILDYPPQHGAWKNFLSMLYKIESDYYMFSDQDDVWLSDKIETEYKAMKKVEDEKGKNKPIVIYSDLIVTDSQLNTISPSLWKIAGIYPQLIHSFNDMAANTVISGCTMLFNTETKKVSCHYTSNVTMHDAWIACCVMKHGGILHHTEQPTMLYRQHGSNTLGAQDVRHPTFKQRMMRYLTSYDRNKRHYMMLHDLSYGSVLKYIWYRGINHIRIWGLPK
ncbi:MAG: glycosyltransferase family 2 protein [Prevotella sp.]|nr:glycosyltransferase family 2 protein [Prevotella sp.]